MAASPTGLSPIPVGAEAGAAVFSTVSNTWEATTRHGLEAQLVGATVCVSNSRRLSVDWVIFVRAASLNVHAARLTVRYFSH